MRGDFNPLSGQYRYDAELVARHGDGKVEVGHEAERMLKKAFINLGFVQVEPNLANTQINSEGVYFCQSTPEEDKKGHFDIHLAISNAIGTTWYRIDLTTSTNEDILHKKAVIAAEHNNVLFKTRITTIEAASLGSYEDLDRLQTDLETSLRNYIEYKRHDNTQQSSRVPAN